MRQPLLSQDDTIVSTSFDGREHVLSRCATLAPQTGRVIGHVKKAAFIEIQTSDLLV